MAPASLYHPPAPPPPGSWLHPEYELLEANMEDEVLSLAEVVLETLVMEVLKAQGPRAQGKPGR